MRKIGLLVVALIVAGCSGTAATQAPAGGVSVSTAGSVFATTGSGVVASTATFNVPASYALDYAYDCGSSDVAIVAIEMFYPDGTAPEYLAMSNSGAKGHATVYGHKGGRQGYLQVNLTPCQWALAVRPS